MNRACGAVKNGFKKVSHVIFDLDGLLLDTERMYKSVIHDIAKKYGKEYTPAIMKKLLGTPTMVTCNIAVTEMKLPISPENFYDIFKHEARLRQFEIGYLPGAETLVRHLHKNNVPIAVATSSSRVAFDYKTKNYLEYFSLFNHIVTGASDPEVKRGKPNPDIFLICAKRFDDVPEPSKCLVLEDAPNGIKAAIDAGMQCIMVPDQEIVTPDFKSDATLVLKSLLELKPEEFGLPAYKNT